MSIEQDERYIKKAFRLSGKGLGNVSPNPHTWQVTNLNKKKVGDFLNIEVDILAKYVEQFMRHTSTKEFDYRTLQEQDF